MTGARVRKQRLVRVSPQERLLPFPYGFVRKEAVITSYRIGSAVSSSWRTP